MPRLLCSCCCKLLNSNSGQQAIMHQASSSTYPSAEHASARATLRQVRMLEDCLEVVVCDLHGSLHASASVLLAGHMLSGTLSTSCMQLCETSMPMAMRTLERTSLKSVTFRTLKARMRNFPSNSLRAPYTLTYTPSRHSLIFCIVCTRSRQSHHASIDPMHSQCRCSICRKAKQA